MTVVAHIGHWYHVFLYLAPVVIVAGGLWFAGKRLPDEGEGPDEFDVDGDPLEQDARGA
ncbi:hypothetical protein [Patulibacter minatonensis]|uniref:hypothetical protein n=1 Tax=Patulibacter minatonensis TaxID=298163 RepID=UPI0004BC4F03|nr:hypothetical protein [Patulibacter minatonensis]